jgi:hypothetical protein
MTHYVNKHRLRYSLAADVSRDSRGRIKNLLKVILIASLALFIFLSFFRPPLPSKEMVRKEILDNDPLQKPLAKKEEVIKIGGYDYKLEYLDSYEIWGLVVSGYNTSDWLDVFHKADPGNIQDICVVWGKNIATDAYKKVRYKSGEYTCYYSWKSSAPEFYGAYLANNHLIPKDKYVTSQIRKAAIGDQIHIKGYLVNYSVSKDGQQIFTRRTSTIRDDTGNGACEIIYVTDLEILAGSNILFQYTKNLSFYSMIISGLIWLGLNLF